MATDATGRTVPARTGKNKETLKPDEKPVPKRCPFNDGFA